MILTSHRQKILENEGDARQVLKLELGLIISAENRYPGTYCNLGNQFGTNYCYETAFQRCRQHLVVFCMFVCVQVVRENFTSE